MISNTETPADTINDRILLPLTFDVEKMKKEALAFKLNDFNYYKVMPLRGPAHIIDPTLPTPPPADDYADGSWTDWLDSPELKASPYLTSVVDSFREHTKVTLVRLIGLQGGNVVPVHTDPTLGLQITESVIRLTIPVISDDQVTFFLNNKPVPMKPGECWYMRLTDPHEVVNSSNEDRVNLTIDMIPNEWVRSMIMEHDHA